MSELNKKQLETLAVERAKIFTPGWFGDLVSGRLGFGDTFWLGLFGVLLFVVPAVVLLAGLVYALATPATVPFLRLVSGLYGIWTALVLRGLWRTGAHGGWPMAGLATTACLAAGALFGASGL